MRSTAAATALVLTLAACGGAATADPDQVLPLVQLHVDEDGPATLDEAVAASDWVVVATVESEEPGARFYGGDDPEDLSDDVVWQEDVALTIAVEEYLRGEGDGTMTIRWPAYLSSEPKVGHRTALLDHGPDGVRPEPGNRYALFLTDFGEPWGVRATSIGSGGLELRDDGSAGERAAVFARDDVTSLEAVRAAAVATG